MQHIKVTSLVMGMSVSNIFRMNMFIFSLIYLGLVIACNASPVRYQLLDENNLPNAIVFATDDIISDVEIDSSEPVLRIIETFVNDDNDEEPKENLNSEPGNTLDGDSNLLQRSVVGIGGGNLWSRSVDGLGGGNLLGRSVEVLGDGNLLRRSVDGLGGGNLLGRSIDGLGGGNLLGISIDGLGEGYLLKRSMNSLREENLDGLGGGNLLKR